MSNDIITFQNCIDYFLQLHSNLKKEQQRNKILRQDLNYVILSNNSLHQKLMESNKRNRELELRLNEANNSNDNEEWEIEKIVGCKTIKGRIYYHIRWKDTWELKDH